MCVLHTGHLFALMAHSLMQLRESRVSVCEKGKKKELCLWQTYVVWNMCVHDRRRTLAPGVICSRQTGHTSSTGGESGGGAWICVGAMCCSSCEVRPCSSAAARC